MVGLSAASITFTTLETVASGGQKKLDHELIRLGEILGI